MLKFARSFCVLAEELHFSRAAARLLITQPALSHQIKMLEAEVGCALLRRSPQQVTLTEAGTVLARELGVALAHVRRAVDEALDVARGDAGALAIGYCELPLAGDLAAIIRRFGTLYPRVEVTLRTLPTNDQAVALVSGSIDIGFLHPPLDTPGLVLRPAGRERMVVAMPPDHGLARQPVLRLVNLATERLIFCVEETATHMHQDILAACARAGFKPQFREVENSWHAMVNQAAAGLGVALVPETLAAGNAAHVVFRTVEDLTLHLHTAIATADREVRPAVAQFLALCPPPP
jgi:DNA-binding transcriptional LysR family regulator